MTRILDYSYVLATIIFTVYGQLILKWRIREFGPLPPEMVEKLRFFAALFLDPFILSGFIAAFLASLAWMAAMTRFQLSEAYPFMGLNFVLVLALSVMLLGENINIHKIVGVALIVCGIVAVARG